MRGECFPSQSWSSFSPLTQLLKEGPNIFDEQVWCGLGGKMVASVIDIPGDDVLVITLRKASDGLIDVGKIAQSERDGGWFYRDILVPHVFQCKMNNLLT